MDADVLGDEAPLRRIGAMVAGTDIRYPLSDGNRRALIGAFAPDLTLDADQGTTSVAELMHPARPVCLDLAGRPELREATGGWADRVDVHVAVADDRPADAVLIRPDAHIAWAAPVGESSDTSVPALRQTLSTWFGDPRPDEGQHRRPATDHVPTDRLPTTRTR